MGMFTIKVNLDLGELEDALERLMDAGHDMTPLTRNISEIMYDATARAFQAEQSPDGKKWAPLTPLTLSRRKGKGKILAPTGGASGLRGSIQAEHDATSARVGTNRIYAGPHQFGARKREFKGVAPWGDLPARPYLGIGEEDEMEIQDAMRCYIEDAIYGRR